MKTNTLDLDTQALRARIIDSAVRGKLIPQDPNDDSASELLKQIKTEKEKLVEKKKIRRSKPLPKISNDEKLFKIPDNWEWVRLGNISNYTGGYAYKSKFYVEKSNNQVVRLGNIKDDQLALENNQVFISDAYADMTKQYRIKENDILFTMTGTRNKRDYFYTLLVHKSDLQSKKLYLNQRVGCLDYIFVDKVWLNYILKAKIILDEVFQNETGTANQGNIGATQTMKILLPMPPLSEQKRIAAKIDQLFNLIQKIETAAQQYDELKTALKSKVLDLAMQGKLVKQNPNDEPASELLKQIKDEKALLVKEKKIRRSKPLPEINDEEKPFVIPKNWEWIRLAGVIVLTSGRDLPKSQHLTNNSVPGSIPYITGASNINDNTGEITISEWTTDTSTVASAGDILISVKGTVGKITQLRLKKAYIARQIMAISHTKSLCNDYLVSYLRWYVTKLKSKARSMIPGISRNDILSSPIPLPPLSEQKRIVAKIEEIFAAL